MQTVGFDGYTFLTDCILKTNYLQNSNYFFPFRTRLKLSPCVRFSCRRARNVCIFRKVLFVCSTYLLKVYSHHFQISYVWSAASLSTKFLWCSGWKTSDCYLTLLWDFYCVILPCIGKSDQNVFHCYLGTQKKVYVSILFNRNSFKCRGCNIVILPCWFVFSYHLVSFNCSVLVNLFGSIFHQQMQSSLCIGEALN